MHTHTPPILRPPPPVEHAGATINCRSDASRRGAIDALLMMGLTVAVLIGVVPTRADAQTLHVTEDRLRAYLRRHHGTMRCSEAVPGRQPGVTGRGCVLVREGVRLIWTVDQPSGELVTLFAAAPGTSGVVVLVGELVGATVPGVDPTALIAWLRALRVGQPEETRRVGDVDISFVLEPGPTLGLGLDAARPHQDRVEAARRDQQARTDASATQARAEAARQRLRADLDQRIARVAEEITQADGVARVLELARSIDNSDLDSVEKEHLLAQLVSPLLLRAIPQVRATIQQNQFDHAEALIGSLTWFVARATLPDEQRGAPDELRGLQRELARRRERYALVANASGLLQQHHWRDARIQLLRAETIFADTQSRTLLGQIERQRASPAAAFGLSFALPGVGQFYSRRYTAGTIFSVGTVGLLGGSIAFLVNADSAYRDYLGASSVSEATAAYPRVQGQANFAVGLGIAAAVLWLVNVIDAPLGAARYNRDELGF